MFKRGLAASSCSSSAVAVGRTQTALGSFYRRLAARSQGAIAAVATARKMAILFYRCLKYGQAFVESGLAAYERDQHERQLRIVRQRASALGYQLQQIPAETPAGAH